MLASRRTNALGLTEAKPLTLAPASESSRRAAGSGRRARRQPTAANRLLVPGLLLSLLVTGGLGLYAFQRLHTLDFTLREMQGQMARRLQQLDAGISVDSRRQRLLLGIRDEVLAVNERLSPDLAYEYATQAVSACEAYPRVDPLLLLALGIAESRYDAQATSSTEARGLYQIPPSTGRMLARMLGWQYTDAILYDAGKNTALAALYLDLLFAVHDDERLVLAEYRNGPLEAGHLKAGEARVSPETRSYLARVLAIRERLKQRFEQAEARADERGQADSPRTARPPGERPAAAQSESPR